MFNLLLKGGPMMYPLLAASIWAVYVIIQKFLFLNYNPILTPSLIEKIKEKIRIEGKVKTIQDLRINQEESVQFIANVVEISDLPVEEVQDRMKVISAPVILKIDRNMNMLSALITVAPMIGLLGTVIGLMDIFKGLSNAASGDPTLMYSGISVALINTVAGLAIAIPAAFFYQFLSHKIEVTIANMEVHMNSFLDFCQTQRK